MARGLFEDQETSASRGSGFALAGGIIFVIVVLVAVMLKSCATKPPSPKGELLGPVTMKTASAEKGSGHCGSTLVIF